MTFPIIPLSVEIKINLDNVIHQCLVLDIMLRATFVIPTSLKTTHGF